LSIVVNRPGGDTQGRGESAQKGHRGTRPNSSRPLPHRWSGASTGGADL